MTWTFSIMRVSPAAYAEIRGIIEALGPEYAGLIDSRGRLLMHEIALEPHPVDVTSTAQPKR